MLLVLLVLVVMFVNRADRPPSDVARDLERIAESAAPVADRDNGYIFALGFSAPDKADAGSVGIAHAEWLRKFMATAGPTEFPVLPGEKRAPSDTRDPDLKRIAALCKDAGLACAKAMDGDQLRLQASVQRNAELIERYETLTKLRQWRELWPDDVRSTFVPLNHVLEGQRLTLMKAWLMASGGDASGCKHLLEQDLGFWRMVLADSSSLIVKVVAARAVEQHFTMGNLALRRLGPASALKGVPDGWRIPVSGRERSMAKVMANEWKFSDAQLRLVTTSSAPIPAEAEAGLSDHVSNLFAPFLLQPQATSNAGAERLQAISALFERDYPAMPGAANALLASEKAASNGVTGISIYNPVGEILVGLAGMENFTQYGFRIADLEGVRRVALLAAQLRSKAVDVENLPQQIIQADLRGPYDGKAFEWNAAEQSLALRRTLAGKPDLYVVY